MCSDKIKITKREESEIKLALFYAKRCGHGTAGHNRLLLIAKMAEHLGISLLGDELTTRFPGGYEIEQPEMVTMATAKPSA